MPLSRELLLAENRLVSDLWLTPSEVFALTGYRQYGRQVELLERYEVSHVVRRDGRPMVPRSQFVKGQRPLKDRREPNWAAIGK